MEQHRRIGARPQCFDEWGTVDIQDYGREQLVEWLSGPEVPNRQDWAAAELMAQAYIDKQYS